MAINRRDFLKKSAAGAAAASFASVVPVFGAEPDKKIRFAQIGCGGRGKAHHSMWRGEEFVAACDTSKRTLNMFNAKTMPNLRKYTNYQEMFEKEMDNIDAVIVATPDHNHFAASMMALNAGKAVYCEKPLAWSVTECLELAKMAQKKKVVTQMGNQGNAQRGWRDCYNIIHSDVIGKVREVKTWTNRPIWPQGNNKPEGEGQPIPEHLDWEAWIGVAPMRAFHGELNFNWRGYYDFGCGALGDMSCHTMNAMFQIMKPDFNCTVEPIMVEGRSNDQFPKKEIIKWAFAKSGDCPGFDCYWYDGNLKPETPEALGPHGLPGTGSMFIGEKGVLITASDYNASPKVYVGGQVIQPKAENLAPAENGSIHQNFMKSVKGQEPWDATCSNFKYAGKMTAIINMGPIAERVDQKIEFSGRKMKFKQTEATALMARKPREGWGKAYKMS